jgi:hypothetical protein
MAKAKSRTTVAQLERTMERRMASCERSCAKYGKLAVSATGEVRRLATNIQLLKDQITNLKQPSVTCDQRLNILGSQIASLIQQGAGGENDQRITDLNKFACEIRRDLELLAGKVSSHQGFLADVRRDLTKLAASRLGFFARLLRRFRRV